MPDSNSPRFAILLDGALRPTDRLRAQVEGCRVLAADGGIRHAAALGVTPELWLGDFDSADGPLSERYSLVPRQRYSEDKALSDGEIAIRHALSLGAGELLLCGALGGDRSDHSFLNLSVAVRIAASEEVPIRLSSGAEEAFPVLPGKSCKPDWPSGTLFSLVSFGSMEQLTIRNARWALDAVDVPFGSTLTLSNVAGRGLQILLQGGCAIVIGQIE